ncbi:MAG: ABC transporter substrate-binding protein [Saccharospirillaceae bacterium]|nr:ABC transporter substrate-binding protein [Pseudomonadales bacterium]NRB81116.1 ABC transporter substrate-binding protein [Saccharospirillaceae bacterium]
MSKQLNKYYIILLLTLVFIPASIFIYSLIFSANMLTVGVARWATNAEFDRSIEGFKQGLASKGYIEGENITYIIRNPETDLDSQRVIINEFIDLNVDLIYSITTPGTIIAQEQTQKMLTPIPVVFSICTYPVESNLIKSLDNSENNLVGTRNYVPFAKQYYVFEQLIPNIKSLAVVRRMGEPNSTNQFKDVKKQLESRGINIIDIAATDLDDIQRQLENNLDQIDGIFSTCDTLTHKGGEEIISAFSLTHKIPTFACNKEGVIKGILVGNIGDFKDIALISGEQAGLILEGANPSWLKTESPRDSYVILNENTAKILGLDISDSFLESVKELIK